MASREIPAGADFPSLVTAFDGVYGPREDSEMLASAVSRYAQGRFLDLGCGTGISGISASQNPAVTSVTFADISPAAVSCAQYNASVNRLSKTNSFIITDLFSAFRGEAFDTIAFNPPYLPTAANETLSDPINHAFDGGASGRNVTNRFLRRFARHLAPNGILLLVDSSLADYRKSIRFLQARGFLAEVISSRRFFFEEVVVIKAARA